MSSFNNGTKPLTVFCSLFLSSLCIAVCNTNWPVVVLNPLSVVFFTLLLFISYYLLLLIHAYRRMTKTLLISVVHLSLLANLSSIPPSAGNEPQTETQVEKVSTLSLVRRDTALLLRDFRQGASNWIHSLLDSNRASAPPSTAAEAPPGATGIPPTATECMSVFVHVCAVRC